MPDIAEAPAGVVLSTYVPRAAAEDLRARAAAQERTVAAELRLALRAYLKNDERRAATPAVVQAPGSASRHDEG